MSANTLNAQDELLLNKFKDEIEKVFLLMLLRVDI